MRDLVTDLLDMLGLLAVAAGAGLALAGGIGYGRDAVAAGAGLAVAGLVVVGGSLLAHMRAGRGGPR